MEEASLEEETKAVAVEGIDENVPLVDAQPLDLAMQILALADAVSDHDDEEEEDGDDRTFVEVSDLDLTTDGEDSDSEESTTTEIAVPQIILVPVGYTFAAFLTAAVFRLTKYLEGVDDDASSTSTAAWTNPSNEAVGSASSLSSSSSSSPSGRYGRNFRFYKKESTSAVDPPASDCSVLTQSLSLSSRVSSVDPPGSDAASIRSRNSHRSLEPPGSLGSDVVVHDRRLSWFSSLKKSVSFVVDKEDELVQRSNIHYSNLYDEPTIYTGTVSMRTGLPHGFGRIDFCNPSSSEHPPGRWYEGAFHQGQWTGHGKLMSKGHGDFYHGGLRNDQKDGRGTTRYADGRVFAGDYTKGRMKYGCMTYPDGSSYNGGWENDLYHGYGKYHFAEGGYYIGDFRKGEFTGYGKCIRSDGGSYHGAWENGEMHGFGVEVRADGSIHHDGLWIHDHPDRRSR